MKFSAKALTLTLASVAVAMPAPVADGALEERQFNLPPACPSDHPRVAACWQRNYDECLPRALVEICGPSNSLQIPVERCYIYCETTSRTLCGMHCYFDSIPGFEDEFSPPKTTSTAAPAPTN